MLPPFLFGGLSDFNRWFYYTQPAAPKQLPKRCLLGCRQLFFCCSVYFCLRVCPNFPQNQLTVCPLPVILKTDKSITSKRVPALRRIIGNMVKFHDSPRYCKRDNFAQSHRLYFGKARRRMNSSQETCLFVSLQQFSVGECVPRMQIFRLFLDANTGRRKAAFLCLKTHLSTVPKPKWLQQIVCAWPR